MVGKLPGFNGELERERDGRVMEERERDECFVYLLTPHAVFTFMAVCHVNFRMQKQVSTADCFLIYQFSLICTTVYIRIFSFTLNKCQCACTRYG